MNDRQSFWLQKERWPRDTAEHVFLARALHLVGIAMFPDWTGAEPVTPDSYLLTQVDPVTGAMKGICQSDASAWQIRYVRKLLQLPAQNHGLPSLTDSQWLQGLKLAAKFDGIGELAWRRFSQVKAAMIVAFESGQLQSTVWIKGSAQMELISSELWSVEDVDHRFHWCLLNPKNPFGPGVGGDNFHPIFVTRLTVDEFTRELAAKVQNKQTSVASNPAAKNYSQAHLQRWFEGQVSNWREAGANLASRPTREEIVEKAKGDNPGVSVQRMRNLWADLAPQEWRGKGPRQKRE